MDASTVQMLFALLRSSVFEEPLSGEEKALFSPEMLPELTAMATRHDLAHLVYRGLKDNQLLPPESRKLEESYYMAIYRHEFLLQESEKLYGLFEAEKIPYLPLKGAVIRPLYPQSWMRTSGDIDILIHREEAEAIQRLLVEQHGYSFVTRDSHVIMLRSPLQVCVELHYNLLEEENTREAWSALHRVWETASVCAATAYRYEMPDAMVYFYHIVHMVKHFEYGGCGIRPLLDLRILDSMPGADIGGRRELLRQADLLTFAEVAGKLSRAWFGGGEYDPLTRQMEDYILRGGVYGSNENRVLIQQQKKGGRLRYLLSKIFLPYSGLKFQYPILEKHPWLMPVMQVRRWGRLIFCGHLNRSVREMQYNSRITSDKARETQQFLKKIGL